jgi:hypothetical protein
MVTSARGAEHLCSPADNAAPLQVWGALAIEQRERVIHLLAQLACTLATTSVAVPPQEVPHVSIPDLERP